MKKTHLSVLLLLFMAGFCLRPGISSIAPLANLLQHHFSVSTISIGLLTTIPVVCMGIVSPLAFLVEKQIGLKMTLIVGLALVSIGELSRFYDGLFALLLLSAILVGTGDALIRPMISGFIKLRCASYSKVAVSVYAAAMGAGAGAAILITWPLASSFGHFNFALAFWALPTLVSLICWCFSGTPLHTSPQQNVNKLAISTGLTLALTLFFTLQAGLNYTLIAWLPAWLQNTGYTLSTANGMTTLLIVVSTFISLIYPIFVKLCADREFFTLLLASLAAVIAILCWGLDLPIVISILLMGVTIGLCFPLALHLPIAVSDNPAAAVRLSGIVQTFGYLAGGLIPTLVGGAITLSRINVALPLSMLTLVLLLFITAVLLGFTRVRRF